MGNEIRVRNQIQKIAENLSSTWFVKNEINILPKLIRENEDVIYLTSGCLTDVKADSAIIALTNERIIFYDELPFAVSQEYDISLAGITNITWNIDLTNAQIIIEHNEQVEKVSNVNREEAETFCRLAQRAIEAYSKKPTKINHQVKYQKEIINNEFINIDNKYIKKSSIIEVERLNDFSIIITTCKVFNGTSFQVLKQFQGDEDMNKFLSQLGLRF